MRKIFLFLFFFCVSISLSFAGDFKIVEIMPNTIDDKNLEYITVKNISNTSQSLSGFTLSDYSEKKYIFLDEILEPGERKDFFRSETKIILNNSDETVFLYDVENNLVDEVYYEYSDKGYFLSFPEEEIEGENEEIISQELLISGELFVSDEVSLDDSEEEESELDSDNLEDEEWESEGDNLEEENILKLSAPEVIVSLQRPSYITQSGSTDIFICDPERDECKVNFDFRGSFSDDSPEGDYICKIDFGFGVMTGEEEKCNPNTVTFPEGESHIHIKIFHKDDVNIYSEKLIYIHKYSVKEEEGIEVISESSSEAEDNDGQENIDQASDMPKSELMVPEIILTQQRPSYITQSGGLDIFMCDRDKEDCKVNFDLSESFSSEMPERDYYCNIEFGFFTGEEEKCNPNTVIFPEGESQIVIKIFHEDDETIFSEKTITIYNFGYLIEEKNISFPSQDLKADNGIYISKPKILVQSGLEGSTKYFYCKKNPCKINLKYEKENKKEQCRWSFRGGSYESKTTRDKCNPGYVTFPDGIFELSLRVFEKNNEGNYKTTVFYIYNNTVKNISGVEEIIVKKVIDEEKGVGNKLGLDREEESENISLEEVSIVLQGKISKEKILGENILTCQGVDKCYINLTSSGAHKNANFLWLLDGAEFSDSQNPKGMWIEGEGMHSIELQYIVNEKKVISKFFQVNVTKQISENTSNDKIGKDKETSQKQNISKIFSQNFLVLKYDGLRISGKAPVGSRVEVFLDGEAFIQGNADEKGKYRLVTKNITAGEYIFSTKIILVSGEEIYLEDFKSYTLTSESRSSWFVAKKSQSKKKSASISSLKIPELIITANATGKEFENITVLSFRERIALIFGIVLILIIVSLHVILLQTTILRKTINLDIFTLSYNTRQKVLLTL